MQHAAGDRWAGGAERRKLQPVGEPAGPRREPAGAGAQQREAGKMQHHPSIPGEDRAGAERGAGTWRAPHNRDKVHRGSI